MGQRTDPFWSLVETAKRLHAPGGCAWDRAQTVDSLLPYLIEETWEVFEVVRSGHRRELQEELGDVLYTVLFLTLIAERRGWLTLDSLLRTTRQKMIRRHPHVFGGRTAPTPQQAYQQWQAIKRQEGTPRYSPSKALRAMLVTWWEWAYAHPGVEGVLRRGRHRGGRGVPGARATGRRGARLVAERPDNPVPGQGKRKTNRKTKHQTRKAGIEERKHRGTPSPVHTRSSRRELV